MDKIRGLVKLYEGSETPLKSKPDGATSVLKKEWGRGWELQEHQLVLLLGI
jgi:hypothetical protein